MPLPPEVEDEDPGVDPVRRDDDAKAEVPDEAEG